MSDASTKQSVECPICGEEFDPAVAGGWCTNTECGEWQYTGEPDEDAGSETEDGGGSEVFAAPEAEGDEDGDGDTDEEPDVGVELDDPVTADESDESEAVEAADAEETDAAEAESDVDDLIETSDESTADIEDDGEDGEVAEEAVEESVADDEAVEAVDDGADEGDEADEEVVEADEEPAQAHDEVAEADADDTAATIDCPDCGAELDAEANFCLECGADVQDVTPADDGVLDACPGCGADVDEDANFCVSCGEDLAAHREGGDDTADKPDDALDALGGDEAEPAAAPESLVLEVDGNRIPVADGDKVGREVRAALMDAGRPEEEAVRIHREHIRFVRESDTFYLVDLGDNPTELNGQPLTKGDREPVAPGDEIELSGVATATVQAP